MYSNSKKAVDDPDSRPIRSSDMIRSRRRYRNYRSYIYYPPTGNSKSKIPNLRPRNRPTTLDIARTWTSNANSSAPILRRSTRKRMAPILLESSGTDDNDLMEEEEPKPETTQADDGEGEEEEEVPTPETNQFSSDGSDNNIVADDGEGEEEEDVPKPEIAQFSSNRPQKLPSKSSSRAASKSDSKPTEKPRAPSQMGTPKVDGEDESSGDDGVMIIRSPKRMIRQMNQCILQINMVRGTIDDVLHLMITSLRQGGELSNTAEVVEKYDKAIKSALDYAKLMEEMKLSAIEEADSVEKNQVIKGSKTVKKLEKEDVKLVDKDGVLEDVLKIDNIEKEKGASGSKSQFSPTVGKRGEPGSTKKPSGIKTRGVDASLKSTHDPTVDGEMLKKKSGPVLGGSKSSESTQKRKADKSLEGTPEKKNRKEIPKKTRNLEEIVEVEEEDDTESN